MKSLHWWVRLVAIAVLIGGTVTLGLKTRREPAAGEAAVYQATGENPFLAQGVDLRSTVDRNQERQIRGLLETTGSVMPEEVTIDYPLDESIFPPDMIAPTFLWHDRAERANRWVADFAFDGGSSHLSVLVPGEPPPRGAIDPRCVSPTNEIHEPTPYEASARAWKPGPRLWEAIKSRSVERPAIVTFFGYSGSDPERVLSRGHMTLSTSRDPVGAPIFYRDVPLMPTENEEGVIKPLAKNAVPLIDWRLRDISKTGSRIMLRDMPTCANCHSFSLDGTTMGIDVDGPEGD